MARIKYKGYTSFRKLLSMLNHAIAPIRGDNTNICITHVTHFILMRVAHSARMKSSDLIIIHIRSNKCLARIGTLNHLHVCGVHVVFFHPTQVGCKVLAYGCHRYRIGAQ